VLHPSPQGLLNYPTVQNAMLSGIVGRFLPKNMGWHCQFLKVGWILEVKVRAKMFQYFTFVIGATFWSMATIRTFLLGCRNLTTKEKQQFCNGFGISTGTKHRTTRYSRWQTTTCSTWELVCL
jgi:hypothetical protein